MQVYSDLVKKEVSLISFQTAYMINAEHNATSLTSDPEFIITGKVVQTKR